MASAQDIMKSVIFLVLFGVFIVHPTEVQKTFEPTTICEGTEILLYFRPMSSIDANSSCVKRNTTLGRFMRDECKKSVIHFMLKHGITNVWAGDQRHHHKEAVKKSFNSPECYIINSPKHNTAVLKGPDCFKKLPFVCQLSTSHSVNENMVPTSESTTILTSGTPQNTTMSSHLKSDPVLTNIFANESISDEGSSSENSKNMRTMSAKKTIQDSSHSNINLLMITSSTSMQAITPQVQPTTLPYQYQIPDPKSVQNIITTNVPKIPESSTLLNAEIIGETTTFNKLLKQMQLHNSVNKVSINITEPTINTEPSLEKINNKHIQKYTLINSGNKSEMLANHVAEVNVDINSDFITNSIKLNATNAIDKYTPNVIKIPHMYSSQISTQKYSTEIFTAPVKKLSQVTTATHEKQDTVIAENTPVTTSIDEQRDLNSENITSEISVSSTISYEFLKTNNSNSNSQITMIQTKSYGDVTSEHSTIQEQTMKSTEESFDNSRYITDFTHAYTKYSTERIPNLSSRDTKNSGNHVTTEIHMNTSSKTSILSQILGQNTTKETSLKTFKRNLSHNNNIITEKTSNIPTNINSQVTETPFMAITTVDMDSKLHDVPKELNTQSVAKRIPYETSITPNPGNKISKENTTPSETNTTTILSSEQYYKEYNTDISSATNKYSTDAIILYSVNETTPQLQHKGIADTPFLVSQETRTTAIHLQRQRTPVLSEINTFSTPTSQENLEKTTAVHPHELTSEKNLILTQQFNQISTENTLNNLPNINVTSTNHQRVVAFESNSEKLPEMATISSHPSIHKFKHNVHHTSTGINTASTEIQIQISPETIADASSTVLINADKTSTTVAPIIVNDESEEDPNKNSLTAETKIRSSQTYSNIIKGNYSELSSINSVSMQGYQENQEYMTNISNTPFDFTATTSYFHGETTERILISEPEINGSYTHLHDNTNINNIGEDILPDIQTNAHNTSFEAKRTRTFNHTTTSEEQISNISVEIHAASTQSGADIITEITLTVPTETYTTLRQLRHPVSTTNTSHSSIELNITPKYVNIYAENIINSSDETKSQKEIMTKDFDKESERNITSSQNETFTFKTSESPLNVTLEKPNNSEHSSVETNSHSLLDDPNEMSLPEKNHTLESKEVKKSVLEHHRRYEQENLPNPELQPKYNTVTPQTTTENNSDELLGTSTKPRSQDITEGLIYVSSERPKIHSTHLYNSTEMIYNTFNDIAQLHVSNNSEMHSDIKAPITLESQLPLGKVFSEALSSENRSITTEQHSRRINLPLNTTVLKAELSILEETSGIAAKNSTKIKYQATTENTSFSTSRKSVVESSHISNVTTSSVDKYDNVTTERTSETSLTKDPNNNQSKPSEMSIGSDNQHSESSKMETNLHTPLTSIEPNDQLLRPTVSSNDQNNTSIQPNLSVDSAPLGSTLGNLTLHKKITRACNSSLQFPALQKQCDKLDHVLSVLGRELNRLRQVRKSKNGRSVASNQSRRRSSLPEQAQNVLNSSIRKVNNTGETLAFKESSSGKVDIGLQLLNKLKNILLGTLHQLNSLAKKGKKKSSKSHQKMLQDTISKINRTIVKLNS